jgi:hypothetical protein
MKKKRNENECWEKGRDGVNWSGLISIPVKSNGGLPKRQYTCFLDKSW